ncbi:MAG: HAMP domain-containing sensor histidine kinase [Acidimicrobiia bacterium]
MTIGALLQIRAVRGHLVEAAETSAESRLIDVAEQARTSSIPSNVIVADDDTQFVQVVDADGFVIAASDNIETRERVVDLDTEPLENEDSEGSSDREYDAETETFSDLPIDDGSQWVVAGAEVPTDEGFVTVYSGTSLEEVQSTLNALRGSLFVAVPVLVFFVGLVTRTVIRRSLQPVAIMRSDLDEITTRRLHHRVSTPSSDNEIADLAHSMNEMLDRLEASVTRERHFIGDASHELRSPIAAMRTQLEVALAHPQETSSRETLGSVLRSTERMEALVVDLLLLAQLDAVPSPELKRPVDLSQLVADEVEHHSTIGAVRVRTILEPDVVVQGHANQLGRLVHNLIDNAVRHAQSQVVIQTSRSNEWAVLEVSDDGPGIPVEDRDRVFERFTRLDEARDRDAGGSGLGLAIAKEVADTHGGSMHITGPPGTTFTFRMPLQPTN